MPRIALGIYLHPRLNFLIIRLLYINTDVQGRERVHPAFCVKLKGFARISLAFWKFYPEHLASGADSGIAVETDRVDDVTGPT